MPSCLRTEEVGAILEGRHAHPLILSTPLALGFASFLVFGQVFEAEWVQLSIHLINLCFPTKCSLVCLGVVHRMDLFPRGAWNTWKYKIPSVEILAKNPTRSCLGLFMGREICENKLLSIQWLKTEQQDGNDEILTSLCSSNKYFSGN